MDNQVTLLGSNLLIQVNKEWFLEDTTGYLLLEKLYDLLGDNDVITINEINLTENRLDYLLMDGEDVFFLTAENIKDLKECGRTCLINQGTLENHIDTSIKEHIDFLYWLGWSEEEINETF